MDTASIVLAAVAFSFRGVAAAAREGSDWLPVRVLGWQWCVLGAWVVAALSGAWAPIWPFLVLGIVGGLLEWAISYQPIVRFLGDVGALGLAAGLSLSGIDWKGFVIVLPLWVGVGLVMDRFARKLPTGLAIPLAASPVFVVGFGLVRGDSELRGALWEADKTFPLHLGVTRPAAGREVRLEGGLVGWLALPPGASVCDYSAGAVLLHGADPAGSHGQAATVLRKALLAAGISVLSIDHPGYGESAIPERMDRIEDWNPMRGIAAAVGRLRDDVGCDPVVVVGHSMGCSGVLQALDHRRRIHGAVMIGGSLPTPHQQDYWYRRFHQDRGMQDFLDREDWVRLWESYYNSGRLVRALSDDHSPVVFVRSGIEWDEVATTRQRLFALLPGPKEDWRLAGVTHYMSAFKADRWLLGLGRVGRAVGRLGGADRPGQEVGQLTVGDVRVTRKLAERMKSFRGTLGNRRSERRAAVGPKRGNRQWGVDNEG